MTQLAGAAGPGGAGGSAGAQATGGSPSGPGSVVGPAGAWSAAAARRALGQRGAVLRHSLRAMREVPDSTGRAYHGDEPASDSSPPRRVSVPDIRLAVTVDWVTLFKYNSNLAKNLLN